MLKATDLRLTFNSGTPIETQALRGMSLEIPTAQFVTVIGSNGAGKSTFLNAVSGEQRVDSGTIEIDGIDMTRQPVWGRARHVARVFQDPLAGTCEDLTIEENMALAKMRGKRYGLVISDWNMEPMTGYELLKEVRADPGLTKTPFIMVTAESKTENVIAAKKAGVNNYIVKPFNAQTLKTKIEAVFGE